MLGETGTTRAQSASGRRVSVVSDTQRPGGPPQVPPDVPPEYADAYLAGFRRAYGEGRAESVREPADPPAEPTDEEAERTEPWEFEPPGEPDEAALDWSFEPPEEAVDEAPAEWEFEPPEDPSQDWEPVNEGEALPEADSWESDDDETRDDLPELVPGFGGYDEPTRAIETRERGHRVPWAAMALLAVLVALLIVGAFFLGKALSGTVSDAATAPGVDAAATSPR